MTKKNSPVKSLDYQNNQPITNMPGETQDPSINFYFFVHILSFFFFSFSSI